MAHTNCWASMRELDPSQVYNWAKTNISRIKLNVGPSLWGNNSIMVKRSGYAKGADCTIVSREDRCYSELLYIQKEVLSQRCGNADWRQCLICGAAINRIFRFYRTDTKKEFCSECEYESEGE